MMWQRFKLSGLCLLLSCWSGMSSATQVLVVGLFPGSAVVVIDGQQKLLKEGRGPVLGVRLLSTDKKGATLEVDGASHYLPLGRAYSGAAMTAPERKRVTLAKSGDEHYYANGAINGFSARMLVDTGASSVAMSSDAARRLGIDYISEGVPIHVQTASDSKIAYRVMLRSVSVQGLTVRNVEAAVLQGSYPAEILLGMSFLGRLKMSFENNLLVLEEKY